MARILVIEDNPSNMELMRYLLEAFGHEALVAHDGTTGIALARSEKPDLVVCDIQLPQPDGFAVVQSLKSDAATAAIPVIAVTALAMVGDRTRILDAGFDGYMSKPIDPQRFVADIERLLAAARASQGPRDARGEPASPRGRRREILVVDDNAVNRELLIATLAPLGFEVAGARDVAEALRMLGERLPDLVVSDLHMPGRDGMALLEAIKANAAWGPLPVILLSSSAWGERDRERALALGAARFLLRPIEPPALLEQIEACLAGRP
jgi:two-component system cell cycle response regulator